MNIRQEKSSDYKEVFNLIKAAFASAEHADGNEQNLVSKLRNSDAFIPELSLVAVDNDIIVGHIMFTKIKINGKTELALAPLSVLPEYQRKGIGTALITEGHNIAKQLGYDCSVVLGSEKYYPKFGYINSGVFGIKAPFDVPAENYMVCALSENFKRLDGIVEYAPEFFN